MIKTFYSAVVVRVNKLLDSQATPGIGVKTWQLKGIQSFNTSSSTIRSLQHTCMLSSSTYSTTHLRPPLGEQFSQRLTGCFLKAINSDVNFLAFDVAWRLTENSLRA